MVRMMTDNYIAMHPELEKLIPIADAITNLFGENTEVVIHDFKNLESSIVYISGDVTRREIGAPATNLVLNGLKNNIDKMENYKTVTNDGKILRSTTTFIRDEQQQIVGCMCINYDITDYLCCKAALEKLTAFPKQTASENGTEQDDGNEFFENNVKSMIEKIIAEAIEELNKPIELMNKEEKMSFVKILDEKGVFLVKGAVDDLAEMLGVSKFTVYNWLEKVSHK